MTQLDDFEKSVKSIIENSLKMKDISYGSTNTSRLWTIQIQKYSSLFATKDHTKFIPGFIKFFNANKVKFGLSIFTTDNDSTKVQDEWLKNIPVITQELKDPWGGKVEVCRGQIIYCHDDPKFSQISIPITEIYLIALKLSKEKGDTSNFCKNLPAIILHSLFSAIYYAIPDFFPERKMVKENVDILFQYIDTNYSENSPSSSSSNIGSGLDGLSKILGTIIKASGVDKSGNIDNNEISNYMSNAVQKFNEFTSDNSKLENIGAQLGTVFNTFNEQTKGKTDIQSILGGIGSTLQNKEVTNIINNALPQIAENNKVNSELINTVSSSAPVDFDPTLQD